MNDYFSFPQKINLVRSLLLKTTPAYIQFYVTARCNLACQQCNIIYADADVDEMTIDQIRAMAHNLARIGVCVVLLIGGEPFIRKDIAQIVSAFSSVGIHVRLQTNGLASGEALRECVDVGARDISISLDTLDPTLQETINGRFPRSWHRAIEKAALVNALFPPYSTAFFGTVLMPHNLNHIKDVIEFATAIGWGVSLVPAHTSTKDKPRGFRTFDDSGACTFHPQLLPRVKEVLENIKTLRRQGYNVYDSDVFIDDIYRFIAGLPLTWRRRNSDVCDSPNLYFAVNPNGTLSPCCDFQLLTDYPVYHPQFPQWFATGTIHNEVYSITRGCTGCMYGSYPEITATARFLRPLIHRFLFFNRSLPPLQKKGADEMMDIAHRIFLNNRVERETADRQLEPALNAAS